MDALPKNKLLEIRPDTVQVVRKLFNLEKPESMKEAVNILNEWIQKQSHFNKKNFSNYYLERSIILCKGSVERAKSQMDKICTLRTLLPNFFGNWNVKTDFGNLFEHSYAMLLPKLTEEHYRVYVCKFRSVSSRHVSYMNLFRVNIVISEYTKMNDYANGYIIIIDFSNVDMLDYLMKLNPLELKQAITINIEGYGVRVKSIHLISESKLIGKLVLLLKQILSTKLASRINVNKNIEELHKTIPRYVLPLEYGGEERSLDILQGEWIDILSSDEHLNYMRDMNTAVTNESCRPNDKFSDLYAGMPGTFRCLSVD